MHKIFAQSYLWALPTWHDLDRLLIIPLLCHHWGMASSSAVTIRLNVRNLISDNPHDRTDIPGIVLTPLVSPFLFFIFFA
jgi:hypothetical protein